MSGVSEWRWTWYCSIANYGMKELGYPRIVTKYRQFYESRCENKIPIEVHVQPPIVADIEQVGPDCHAVGQFVRATIKGIFPIAHPFHHLIRNQQVINSVANMNVTCICVDVYAWLAIQLLEHGLSLGEVCHVDLIAGHGLTFFGARTAGVISDNGDGNRAAAKKL